MDYGGGAGFPRMHGSGPKANLTSAWEKPSESCPRPAPPSLPLHSNY